MKFRGRCVEVCIEEDCTEACKRGKPELAFIQGWQDHMADGIKSSVLSFSSMYYCYFVYQNVLLGLFEIKLVK